MTECVICEKEILDNHGWIEDAKRRAYHESCLRAALSELDKWGIEMLRQFATSMNLSIRAVPR